MSEEPREKSGEILLSVVIPAYNEENRIGLTLPTVVSFLKAQKFVSEVVFVDDGSHDKTVSVAEKCLREQPHQIILNKQNQGKGSAVKKGMLAAKGVYRLFTDADLSTPIETVIDFIEDLKSNCDVAVGSRALRDSDVAVRQSIWRESMGRIYNLLARMFAFHNISDSQCGFKCFKGEAAETLFSLQKLQRFSFDAEIIYLAQKQGYKVLEKPVTWRNSPQSRVNVIKDSLNMFVDLIRIRWIHR